MNNNKYCQYKYKCGLYLGRFQPFHNGHLHIIEQMLPDCEHIIVAIGSVNSKDKVKNPFSFELRRKIIESVLRDCGYQYRVSIIGIEDREEYGNDNSWGEFVKKQVNEQGYDFDVVYEGGEIERINWYSSLDIPRISIPRIENISATDVRLSLRQKEYEKYCELVPKAMYNFYDILRNDLFETRRQKIVNWIKDYFKDNKDGKAIIGISGGKDSTVAAALCVEALGADRVIGVLMPNMVQNDIYDSYEITSRLQIQYHVVNIGAACNDLYHSLADAIFLSGGMKAIKENTMIQTNLPARLRMATLYAVAALYPNSRVCGTSNLSEITVGYCTKGGDTVNDFAPLATSTVGQVYEIGDEYVAMGWLPSKLVYKTPSDGMSGMSDEEKLGISYEKIDKYATGGYLNKIDYNKIHTMHLAAEHKFIPSPRPNLSVENTKEDKKINELNNIIEHLLLELRNHERNE